MGWTLSPNEKHNKINIKKKIKITVDDKVMTASVQKKIVISYHYNNH